MHFTLNSENVGYRFGLNHGIPTGIIISLIEDHMSHSAHSSDYQPQYARSKFQTGPASTSSQSTIRSILSTRPTSVAWPTWNQAMVDQRGGVPKADRQS